MVSIGCAVKALGLTQFLHYADFAKFEFWSDITYPYTFPHKIRTKQNWEGLKPNLETRQAHKQLAEKVWAN